QLPPARLADCDADDAPGSDAALARADERAAELRGEQGGVPIRIRYWPLDPLHRSPGDPATLAPPRHPDHVRDALAAASTALRVFRQYGFRRPLLTDGALVVELRRLDGFRGATSPDGPIRVERRLRGAALRATIVHETFHRVQYAYNAIGRSADEDGAEGPFVRLMAREGGARVAELLPGDGGLRYEADADGWFGGAAALLTSRRGPRRIVEGGSYDTGLFWKYLAEQHGAAPPGHPAPALARIADTQRALLEASVPAGGSREAPMRIGLLREARARMRGIGHFDRFWHLDEARTELACGDTAWGNFLVALALNGQAGADSRFRFADAGLWRGVTAGRLAIPAARTRALEALGEEWDAAAGLDPSPMLHPYAVRAFRLLLPAGSATRLLRIRFEPLAGLDDALVQVIQLDAAGELQDLHRHDGEGRRAMDRTIACRGTSEVVILVASREGAGDFGLRVSPAPDAPLLAAASWNGVSGRAMTADPAEWDWNWQTPDIRLDTEGGRWLAVIIRNRGTRDATGVEATAWRRPLVRGRIAGAWQALPQPMRVLPVVTTEDRCEEIARDAGRSEDPGRVPGSCPFVNGVLRPLSRGHRRAFVAAWDDADPLAHVVKIVLRAPGDPNGALVLLSALGGRVVPPPAWAGGAA
ncbi:MAG: hypothetical protein K2X11_03120, partial [Acetobacteraceae bacterium]|nr:hypothetical protein [Acetobacteraceae bacterium]